jgi:23S rRNA (adenine2030-N6)-methyltransferase
VANVMGPYLDAVRAENPKKQLEIYPGSPLIARHLMREQDVLVANELHPEDWADLKSAIGRDGRVKLLALDGWVALKSLLPPKERRAVVLIDPPFEQEGEFDRLSVGLAEALRRFETGVYIAWYPIKDPKPIAAFHSELGAMAGPELLRLELMIRGPGNASDRLNGCGLIIANPPFTLREHLAAVLPELTQRLAEGSGARHRLDRIAHTPSRAPVRTATSHRRNAPRR